MAEAPLARFIDRYTAEYVRTYPHPIERVWRAIVEPAEFSVWFIPGRLDPKVGGRYWFGDDGFQGAVDAIEPPRLLRLADDNQGQVFQYELTSVGAGTRMQFLWRFPRDGTSLVDPSITEEQRRIFAAGDLSAYPNWKPGALGGFHSMWDGLADHLDGVPIDSRLPPTTISEFVREWATESGSLNDYAPEEKARRADVHKSLRSRERWMELIGLYRAHVDATLPPADPKDA